LKPHGIDRAAKIRRMRQNDRSCLRIGPTQWPVNARTAAFAEAGWQSGGFSEIALSCRSCAKNYTSLALFGIFSRQTREFRSRAVQGAPMRNSSVLLIIGGGIAA